MRVYTTYSWLLGLSLAGIGCVSEGTDPTDSACSDPNTPGCEVTSNKERITTPSVPDADREALSEGNSSFALNLYQRVVPGADNLFYSPYSISSALAMTYAGARGETEQQMADALQFTLSQAALHPAFNALDLALASRGEGASGQDGGKFRLTVANAMWGQIGYSFQAPFLDTLAENYGAGLRVVDFIKAPDGARKIINGWVEERTAARIKDLLPPDAITPDTRLVLTNAIYFNAAWEMPFTKEATAPGDFERLDGSTVSVPMMKNSAKLRYGEGGDFSAVELPYDGGELSMLVVLPTALATFEATLDAPKLAGVLTSLGTRLVDVEMPKFKVESTLGLVKPLSDLGMPIAFTDAADFSGINGQGGLAISDVIHKAFVSVDEAGTEAAAATAVIIGETSAPEPASFHVDRPFLFFIRDIPTSTILFIGRVVDPS